MYLTDFREYCLKDVITQFEPGLFKKVTGLSVKDFEMLVSIGIFNDSLMNNAVYNFKRYEDASLEYTGISKHIEDENVGLFSTVISKDDYVDMAAAQTASMEENPFKKIIVLDTSEAHKKEVKKAPVRTPVNPGYSVPGFSTENAHSIVAETNTQPFKKTNVSEIDLSQLRKGTIVINKRYGEGKISTFKPGKVLVSFSDRLKAFQIPEAFEQGYLTVKEW